MTIINASTEDKKILYKLTRDRNRLPMKKAPEIVDVDNYAIYEDVNNATGEVVQLASILDIKGNLYTTNSATFIDDFSAIVEAFPDVQHVKVERMTSKKNREFLVCSLAD